MEYYLAAFIEHLTPIIVGILGTVILKIMHNVSRKYGDKIDIETKQRTEALTTDLIHESVARSEQWAKSYNHGGRAKLGKAVEYAVGELRRNKLSELSENVLVEKIEATLGFATVREQQNEIIIPTQEEDDDESDIYNTE